VSSLPLVAFDESGNSKGNLLDAQQPVLVVGSVCLTDEEASGIVDRFYSATKLPRSNEIHFAGLRSDRGRTGIVSILESEALNTDTARAALAHKEFTAVCKLVDLTLEPMWYEMGRKPLRTPTGRLNRQPALLDDREPHRR
jgi:hypothetical protein